MVHFLYILWDPSSTAFKLGPLEFHWYSLCWLAGLALAYLCVQRLYKEQKVKPELFDPLFIYCFIGAFASGDQIKMTQSAIVLENLISQFIYSKAAE